MRNLKNWLKIGEKIASQTEALVKPADEGIKPELIADFVEFNRLIGLPRHPATAQPMELMPYQKEFAKEIRLDRDQWFIINKARQQGVSELMLRVLAFHAFHKYKGFRIMIVAGNTQKHANRLMRRLKELFTKIPTELETEKEEYLKLRNGTEYYAFPSNPASYRGIEKVKAIFLDEAAHYDFVDDHIVYNALEPITLAGKPDLFMVSTPNGRRGFFYALYVDAVAGKNNFRHIEWNYEKALGWLYTEEDIEKKRNDPTIHFDQEYNCKFTSTVNSIFGELKEDPDLEAFQMP
jgi:hypothetical protein